MTTKKKLFSMICTICMMFMLLPMSISAEGGTTPTYDLWQKDGVIYYAEAGTHIDFNTAGDIELPQGESSFNYKLPYSGTYVLQTDIAMAESKRHIDITTSGITLDLNGKVMTSYSTATMVIGIKAENATILDSVGGGTINGEIYIAYNSSLTLNSGTIEKITCYNGILYADGGTVNEAQTTGGQNGTITQHTGTTGTTFTGEVENGGRSLSGTISGGIFDGDVINGSGVAGTFSNGVFYGKVFNYSHGNITGGEFHGEVENTETITGGVFYDKVLNKRMEPYYIAKISGGVFYGGIQDNGGTITDPYHTVSFDLNGASGTAPVTQYFVNTDTAQALEPAAPTREGYEFAGWYNGETKYNFTENVTENITLKAKWENSEAPVITGLENGKTYCDTVQFKVSDNVGVASVTANSVTLTPDANNKYTLEKGTGTVTVVATDKADNQTSVTVTVNADHTYEWKSANGQYWKKCNICGEETAKQAIPVITLNTVENVCRTQDLSVTVEVPEGLTQVNAEYAFTGAGDSVNLVPENGTLSGKVSANNYIADENEFDVTVNAVTSDGFAFSVTKRIAIQNDHAGGTATCTEKAICSTCGEEYGELTKHSLIKTEAKGATCTEDGNIEYWTCSVCHKIFSDEQCTTEISLADTVSKAIGHTLNKVNAKDSTVAAVGNIEYWQCDDCDENFSDSEGTHPIKVEETVVRKKRPSIIEGTDQTIKAGEKKALTFRSNAEFADFIEVKIDGKTLDPKHYTVKEGSTIVTVKAYYVSTLSIGTHTIDIVSEGGTAETTFTIQAKKTVDTSDRTGLLMWSGIMLMSVALITVLGAFRKHTSLKNL